MEIMIQNSWITLELPIKQINETNTCLKSFADKVAALELRENKHTKDECLRQLREWIKQNPDIKNCITGILNNIFKNVDFISFAIIMRCDVNTIFADDSFLLRFLRAKKYSLIMAQQTLLKYLNLRKTFPYIFSNMDYRDSKVNEIISNG